MNLTGIIAISGRPGLYKVIAQGKNNVIVESLVDRKRFPAYSSDRISALDDISVYTYEVEKPLKEIFKAIFEKENGGETISHKDNDSNLITYILEVLPNYDQERVYISDIKKVFQWYNLLHKAGELKLNEVANISSVTDEETLDSEKVTSKKSVSAKTTSDIPKGVKAKTVVPKGKDDKTLSTKTMSTQNNI
jgi:hypothetical protein